MKKLFAGVTGLVLVIGIAVFGAFLYINGQLGALSSLPSEDRLFTVEEGDTVALVAQRLEDNDFIQSAQALKLRQRFVGRSDTVKQGDYLINDGLSAGSIMEILVGGEVATKSAQFIPGQELIDIVDSLEQQGFDRQLIAAELEAINDTVSIDRTWNDMEGLLAADTYSIGWSGSPKEALQQAFDQTLAYQERYGAAIEAQGYTFGEGLTLASIIQKETSRPDVMKKVSAVFNNRLASDINLGADVTFVYASNKAGLSEPQLDIDSPYNTRIYSGIPPGPISNFTEDALIAVAEPAETNALFFVAGDDGTVHFADTLDEHESNVLKYCTTECQ